MKKLLSILLVLTMVVSLAACSKDDHPQNDAQPPVTDKPATTDTPVTNGNDTPAATATAEPTPEIKWDGAYMGREDFLAYTAHDIDTLFTAIEDQLDDAEYTAVKAVVESGKDAVNAATSVDEARNAYQNTLKNILNAIPKADGLITYKKESNAERTNILGILEQFAIAKGLTGISLFEDGSYNYYNPRITLGTENYIIGYGFGLLTEGSINSDLDYETNEAWKRYYHTFSSEDPGTMNHLNDKRTTVSDLFGYIATTFYETFMNETKDGYEWVPTLAKEKPQPVNDDDGDGMCSTWRFEVRTGDDGLKYKTGSQMADRKAFDGRPVALEDYEYAFKLLLTQSNELYRGSETANTLGDSAIKGAKEFYDGTADGFNEKLWENVGIKTYNENGKNYFEITFAGDQTQFYAMYSVAYTLYMPIPEDFIKLVSVKKYLGFSDDGKETPVDNSLALGPYYVERYDSDQQIVFAKNPYYVYAETKYQIPGVHEKIFTAAKDDSTAAMKEVLAGHFDGCVIPQEFLNDYKNDPNTRVRSGTSNFKLNVNACDETTWEYLFGENGVVTQTEKADYWNVKPALGNDHFRKAISLSLNRGQFADARGKIGSVDFYSSNYMSDPENGIAYATTDAHKKAVEQLLEDTDGKGYSLELSRDYFRMALTELEKSGLYAPGTKDKPTEINIEVAWQTPDDDDKYHKEVKNLIETAFNDESVCGGVYKLNINFWVGNEWSDVYYNKMLIGQFDIGFGSISGEALDPIGFISILSSDPVISGGFTLNFGVDTNDPDVYPIVYDGKRWSFDSLFAAANGKAIVSAGQNTAAVNVEYTNISKNDDGSYNGSFKLTASLADKTVITVEDIECCNYDRYTNGDGVYVENPVEFTCDDCGNGVYVVNFNVPAEIVAEYTTGEGLPETPTGATGFDIYYTYAIEGDSNSTYYSANDNF